MTAEKLIVKMQFGSHVYGTNLPTSDTDYKAIYLPTAKDILLQRVKGSIVRNTKSDPNAKNTGEDVDVETLSLQRYMQLLLEGQTIALNMLFTPDKWILQSSEIWEQIRHAKDAWLHSGVSAFVGYCKTQAGKYGIRGSRVAAVRAVIQLLDDLIAFRGGETKLRDCWHQMERFASQNEHAAIVSGIINHDKTVMMLEVCNRKVQEHCSLQDARAIFQMVLNGYGQRALAAEKNDGVDWKATGHAVRVCHEAQELLLTGHITYPRPEAELLLKIRKGEMPYREVAEIIEAGMDAVEAAGQGSKLPKEPRHDVADTLVSDVYAEVVREWREK